MKKSSHKNQIVITALAVMIVVAGYLNFTGEEISTNSLSMSSSTEQTMSPEVAETSVEVSDAETDEKVAEATENPESEDDVDMTDISAEDIGEDSDYVVTDSGELQASEDNPGEAVMVSNSISADYFSSAKLTREQTRAKNKETLLDIINDSSIASADKQSAIKQVARITKISEKESAAELMLQAKGFDDAMVSISEGNADVVVSSEGLTEQQIAQIEDIVVRKTGIDAANIVITPVSVQ